MKQYNYHSILPFGFLFSLFLVAILNYPSLKNTVEYVRWLYPDDVQEQKTNLEKMYTSSFAGKTNYIDLNGGFSLLLDKVFLNDTIKLKNGSLVTTFMDINTTPYGENMLEFTEYLEYHGYPFAYIQAMGKLPTDDDIQLPTGYHTYPNRNADRLLGQIEGMGIATLDLREKVEEDGLYHYDLFPVTDPHWTISASFWAYTHVAQFIEEQLGYPVLNPEYLDISSFHVEEYSNKWFGPTGQRTGVIYSGVDNFTLIYPQFETQYRFEIPRLDLNQEGSFQEACMNMEHFNLPVLHDKYGTYNYHQEYVKITNYNADNDLKIFLHRDSYAGPLALFLSLHFAEVHLFDTRLCFHTEDLFRRIQEVEPDIVLQFQTYGLEDDRHFDYMSTNMIEELGRLRLGIYDYAPPVLDVEEDDILEEDTLEDEPLEDELPLEEESQE